jgi:glycolate oxidase
MEMMDRLATEAAEAFVHAGYPLDAEALLIVELDGVEAEVNHLVAEVESIAKQHGARSCRSSQSEEERLLFWAGRKAAFPAAGRLAPDYYCMDGTIPRKQIGHVLRRLQQMEGQYGLRVGNVFHAGDGNLHPLILYDANKPGELEKAEEFGNDILRLCVEVGGVLTGEHGVGVEKRDLMPTMFNEHDLNQQQRLKCAFDPDSLLNPGKVFPQLRRCAELGRMHVHGGKLRFADIPRF